MKFALMITCYVLLNSFGQLLIKIGTGEIKSPITFTSLINLKLLSGIFLFGLSFLTWIFILAKTNLSYSFPFAVGFGYTCVILLSAFILKEQISPFQVVGISFVGVGLVLIAFHGA